MLPLNPRLYNALTRVFDTVKISNQGEPMFATYGYDFRGNERMVPTISGESYVVVCPYCHDTSGHLYINHRWGVRDPVNNTKNLWLANCFLDDCMKDWLNQKDLSKRIEDYSLAAAAGLVRTATVADTVPPTKSASSPAAGLHCSVRPMASKPPA